MTRILAIADTDSYLKSGASTIVGLSAGWIRDQVVVHNPVAPSPAQVLAAAGRPVPTRTAREILAGIGDDRPDVVLLACTGPVVEGLSRSLSSYPHRLVLLTGLPGISVPPSRSALVRRRSCDLFLCTATGSAAASRSWPAYWARR